MASGRRTSSPPRARREARERGDGETHPAQLAAVIVLPSGALAWAALTAWPSGVGLMLLGLIVGLVPSVLIAGWLSRREGIASLVPIAVVLSGAIAGVGLLHLLNGAFDGSAGQVTRGTVTTVNGPLGSSSTVEVKVRWTDGTTEWIRASRSTREGEHVERTTHQGALGFAWTDGP
mgnify:CR=1 FL=1